MSTTTTAPAPRVSRGKIAAWASWDWGSAAFNAVVTTFVFTRWITSDSFARPGMKEAADAGGKHSAAQKALDSVLATHSEWLGWGIAAAGVVVALLAPVLGSRADDTGHRKRWLGIYTYLVVVCVALMCLVRPDPDHLAGNVVFGIVLLAVGTIFFELAGVNYNAMLPQISPKESIGRISGIGWASGYIGGIVLLLILFVGFINPDVGWFGVTHDNGMNIRVSVALAAVWLAVFALPVLIRIPEVHPDSTRARIGFFASYKVLFADIARLWHTERQLLYFMISSAVFRDGLTGVFTFGAVIASGTFGFSDSAVVIFAIAANLIAGLATLGGGWLDDRIGPKRVIVLALTGLLIAGVIIFVLHDGGATVFWIFGLALCMFVGPAQSASRSLVGRLIPPGRESEIYGLYATTGRAATFMAPFAFSTMIAIAGTQYWGILGILAVIALGLGLLLPVRMSAPGLSGRR